MSEYSFYSPETGEFSGVVYSGPDDHCPNYPGMARMSGRYSKDGHAVRFAPDDFGSTVPTVVQKIPESPPDGHEWGWHDASGWVLVPTLAGLRASRWAQLREQRDALEISPLTVLGNLFDVNERAVARISLAIKQAEARPGWSTDWTLADNSTVLVTDSDLVLVLLELAARGEWLHKTGRLLRGQIASATTAAQVAAVQWPEYPA